MTLETVQKLRTLYQNTPNKSGNVGNSPLFVIVDNVRYFNDKTAFLKWDDANEILYQFSSPDHHMSLGLGSRAPIQILATAYEHIQYIGQEITYEVLKNYIGPQLGLNDNQIEAIRKDLAPEGEERIKSIRTSEQLKVLEKEDEIAKAQYDYDHNVPPRTF